MNPAEILRNRYRQVALRYGQVIGTPPPMQADVDELRKIIAKMVDTLNGRVDAKAGAPTKVGDTELRIFIPEQGEASGSATVELLDAAHRRAGTRMVTLQPVSLGATVQTLLDAVAEIGKLPQEERDG